MARGIDWIMSEAGTFDVPKPPSQMRHVQGGRVAEGDQGDEPVEDLDDGPGSGKPGQLRPSRALQACEDGKRSRSTEQNHHEVPARAGVPEVQGTARRP